MLEGEGWEDVSKKVEAGEFVLATHTFASHMQETRKSHS